MMGLQISYDQRAAPGEFSVWLGHGRPRSFAV